MSSSFNSLTMAVDTYAFHFNLKLCIFLVNRFLGLEDQDSYVRTPLPHHWFIHCHSLFFFCFWCFELRIWKFKGSISKWVVMGMEQCNGIELSLFSTRI